MGRKKQLRVLVRILLAKKTQTCGSEKKENCHVEIRPARLWKKDPLALLVKLYHQNYSKGEMNIDYETNYASVIICYANTYSEILHNKPYRV